MALTCNGLILTIVILLAIDSDNLLVKCQEQLTVESRQQKDNDELTDTIKYLEKLDKYFSQIARPRFGRSDLKQPVFQFGHPAVGISSTELPQYGSLIELVNNRLNQNYKNLAY